MAGVKHFVLPEGEENRNIQAAAKIAEADIAKTACCDSAKAAEAAAATVTDLLNSCSAEDSVATVSITACQAWN